jgi:predicted NUDIX family NTP pyrophosphohydrolase
MRAKTSAGLLMYRFQDGELEVFLAHPGGPYFARKDEGHWTIPKGEIEPNEEALATAIREFKEEVGIAVAPEGEFIPLGSIRQRGGKTVHAWGVAGDCANTPLPQTSIFTMEWPPKSGKMQAFPEVDRAQFFPMEQAKRKIKDTQRPLLLRLEEALDRQKHQGAVEPKRR